MKLLIITQKIDAADSNLGFFIDWIITFSKKIEKVTVVCLYKGDYDLPKNVKVLSLGKESGVSRVKYIYRFYKHIIQERKNYDTAFVHMNPIYVILGFIIFKINKTKIGMWYTHKSVDLRLKISTILSDIIFSASKDSFRLKTNKLFVTGHGINPSLFISKKNIVDDNRDIITTGRLSSSKRVDLIIKAFNILKDKDMVDKIKIVGASVDGKGKEYKEELDILVEKSEYKRDIIFCGSVRHSEIPKYLQTAKYYVNASNTGSLDKGVLEAVLSGLIPVSSNVAFKELFGKYTDILFFDGGCESLVGKIMTLEEKDPKELRDVSLFLQKKVRHDHGLDRLIDKIKNIYETGK